MNQTECGVCARPLAPAAPHCFACAARPQTFALPERVGPYPVLRQIGSGGMGCVYAGLQHCPEREVAIKVIKEGVFADEVLRTRFLSEREIAGAFEHPNIIRVYDAGEDEDGLLYYVMELASRGTLREFICSQPMSQREAVRLMIEVAFAVDHAHRHGVLHRDLKPDNILIGEDRRARVTDFGVARILDDTRSANEPCESTLVGSYPYMAPEQAGYPNPGQPAATGEPTPAADIYSLGAIMYELVYGAAPYPVHTREELWRAFDTGPPRPLQAWRRGFDYDLEAVIMKALDRDPAQRYPTAAAFADDLRRSLGRRAPTARARSLRGRLVSTLVHHAAWFSILVAALSISAGAVTSINQTTLRARLLEHANLRQQTTRTARAIERIFKHAAGVTRQLASDPRTLDALASAARPDAPGWLEHLAQDNDLISTVFVLDMDGRPAAHFPRELDSYYQRHFQRRVYFRGARLATQQGLGLDVFVSPLFLSFAQDRLVKLAFSAPVYDANHTQRGVAVATVALETLTREVAHPALSLIAPREGAPSETASPNIELVRVDYGPSGKLNLTREGTITRQVYVANVAHTDYAVVARLEEPSLGDLRHGLVLGIMALVSLCVLTLFLFRRARSIAP